LTISSPQAAAIFSTLTWLTRLPGRGWDDLSFLSGKSAIFQSGHLAPDRFGCLFGRPRAVREFNDFGLNLFSMQKNPG
jgi:hypothetical protein